MVYLDLSCMLCPSVSASPFVGMTRLLAWQLLNALKLQAVALNWLRFSVFLA